jgi:hypothetical protein
MSKTIITKKELEVPVDVLVEVSAILVEHDIPNQIIDTDEEEDSITIEVSFAKDQREVIHEVEDVISDYEEEDDEDDDNDNNSNDD